MAPHPRDLPQDDRRYGGRALGAALAEPARFGCAPYAPAHLHHGVTAPSSGPEDPHVPRWGAREPGPLWRIPAAHRRAPSQGHRDHELPPGVSTRDAELPEPAPRGVSMEQ